jgi:hypothetical protein
MPSARFYQCEGGSSTGGAIVGAGNVYPALYIADAIVPTTLTNRAGVDGGTLAEFVGQQQTIIDAFVPPSVNLITVSVSNDLPAVADANIPAFAASFASYLDTFMATNCFVVTLTTSPRADTQFNTRRNLLNPIIRTWAGTHCHAVCDFGGDSIMGADATGFDTNYLVDGTHWSQAMHNRAKVLLKPVLDLFLHPRHRFCHFG